MKYNSTISQQDLQIIANQIGHVMKHYALETEPKDGKTDAVFETVGLYFDNKNIEIHCDEGYLPPDDFDLGIFSIIDWAQKKIPSGVENKDLINVPVEKVLTKIELLQEHVVATNSSHCNEWELDHVVGFIFYFGQYKFIVNKRNSWSDFIATSFGSSDLPLPQTDEWQDEKENGIEYHYESQLKQFNIMDLLKS
ncbi:MAG: hypothetical protein PHX61_13645 [Alphaproteobacteria bacterium]|nr:hypothetical protein [Alphaproteobacteria bacterium]